MVTRSHTSTCYIAVHAQPKQLIHKHSLCLLPIGPATVILAVRCSSDGGIRSVNLRRQVCLLCWHNGDSSSVGSILPRGIPLFNAHYHLLRNHDASKLPCVHSAVIIASHCIQASNRLFAVAQLARLLIMRYMRHGRVSQTFAAAPLQLLQSHRASVGMVPLLVQSYQAC